MPYAYTRIATNASLGLALAVGTIHTLKGFVGWHMVLQSFEKIVSEGVNLVRARSFHGT